MARARAIRPGFFEAIVAPGYTPEALEILRTKRGFEIVEIPPADIGRGRARASADFDFKRIGGGLLVQTFDEMEEDRDKLQPVTQRRPTLEELTDLLFAWRAVRHVKSNAVVLAKKHAMVGMGAGQPSRVVSVEVALRKAGERAPLSVMASDAYFPFPDGIQIAAQAGVTAIIQPGGSHPRRDGDRGRGPPPHGDGLHRPPPLQALMVEPASRRIDKIIIAEAIRATEAGAIAAARLMGRGDRDGADQAAVDRHAQGDGRRGDRRAPSSSARASGTRRRCSSSASRSATRMRPLGRHRGRSAGGHEPRRHRLARTRPRCLRPPSPAG